MRLMRTLGVVVVVLALALAASSAQAAAKVKKVKKPHAIHGVVTKVDRDKDMDGRTITVLVGAHKAKNGKPAAEGVTKTFKVTDATQFFLVSGKKGVDTKPGTFADVKDGEHIALEVEKGTVLEAKVHGHHHKKKNA